MKYSKWYIFLFSCFYGYGCTKEIKPNLNDVPRRLVVEGNIYNTPGPYYIRLTLSNSGLFTPAYNIGLDQAEPVKNALVILSDNAGNIDTLKPSPDSITTYSKFYHNRSTHYDSVLMRYKNLFDGESGFYETSKIRGVPERTYHLRVVYNNKEYMADAYMPPITVIDSVGFKTKFGLKGDPYITPTMFFLEPQNSVDYYWTFAERNVKDENMGAGLRYANGGSYLPYSIFNDNFLLPYANGVYCDFTYTKNGIPKNIITDYGFVYLGSVTEKHYNFLKVIIDQMQSDGGAYKPTPATPPTNISNGALGFFGASALSRYFVFAPDFP